MGTTTPAALEYAACLAAGTSAPYAGRDHDVSHATSGEQQAAGPCYLAEMEMTPALLVAEVGPEGDRQTLRQAYVAVAVRKWRDGEHDRHREPGQAPERAPIAGQELPEEFGPAIGLEHRKNGIPGVAKPAGELERPDAVGIHHGVQVDVPAVACRREPRLDPRQGGLEELLAPLVSRQRAHLAGELAKVARKEALVLPVEAGGSQELAAVEVSTDAHLHPAQVLHEHEAHRGAHGPGRALPGEDGEHVCPVLELAHVGPSGREARAVRLVHVAPWPLADKPRGVLEVDEDMCLGGREPERCQKLLSELTF